MSVPPDATSSTSCRPLHLQFKTYYVTNRPDHQHLAHCLLCADHIKRYTFSPVNPSKYSVDSSAKLFTAQSRILEPHPCGALWPHCYDLVPADDKRTVDLHDPWTACNMRVKCQVQFLILTSWRHNAVLSLVWSRKTALHVTKRCARCITEQDRKHIPARNRSNFQTNANRTFLPP
jgi:hypothetical protein